MATHPFLDTDGPIAIAHRGGAGQSPENTIGAFSTSYELGFRYLETDAQLTADGVVVAFHDAHIDRVSERTGKISDWLWRDLRSVPIEGQGRLVTVEDLLGSFPDARFNLDAKSDDVLIPLLEVVERADAFERVCIGSFSDRRLEIARRMCGERLCTSLGPLAIVNLIGRSRGIGRRHRRGDAAQVPPSFRGIPVITERLIDVAHELGLVVHAWTIDDSDEMHRLLDLGIDGIMTDEPTTLRSVMESRGLW